MFAESDNADHRTPRSNTSGRNYALGAVSIIASVAAITFLDDSTAVFIAVAAAVAGAVCFVIGIQSTTDRHPDTLEQGQSGLPETHHADSDPQIGHASLSETAEDPASTIDWDADFRREFGDGGTGGAPKARR